MHWVIAILMVLSVSLFILSISSLISMFKIGRMDYIRNIKLLFNLRKKLNQCYQLSKTPNYYFPIYLSDKKIFIIHKSLWCNLSIYDGSIIGENWTVDTIEIKTPTCILMQILNDRFQSKLDKLIESKIILKDIKDLNELVNSEVLSIRRNSKLNLLING